MAEPVDVVGAVIVREGLVLCAQRQSTNGAVGLWEFPGGKLEQGETLQAALKREILEELRCGIEVGDRVAETIHAYPSGTIRLHTFYCELSGGEPEVTEHQRLVWLDPAVLGDLDWSPADVPAVDTVRDELSN